LNKYGEISTAPDQSLKPSPKEEKILSFPRHSTSGGMTAEKNPFYKPRFKRGTIGLQWIYWGIGQCLRILTKGGGGKEYDRISLKKFSETQREGTCTTVNTTPVVGEKQGG